MVETDDTTLLLPEQGPVEYIRVEECGTPFCQYCRPEIRRCLCGATLLIESGCVYSECPTCEEDQRQMDRDYREEMHRAE